MRPVAAGEGGHALEVALQGVEVEHQGGGVDGGKCVARAWLPVGTEQAELWAARRAGVGLGVEAAVEGIVVLARAVGAQGYIRRDRLNGTFKRVGWTNLKIDEIFLRRFIVNVDQVDRHPHLATEVELVRAAELRAAYEARVADLRRNVPWELIMIIASSLVISEVMISTGVAKLMASVMLAGADRLGPYWALAVLLLVTWILTELMSNNAAAALAFPVALGVAEQLGLSPMPFIMAVLYGASCSFITPYGYQTNLMVMAPGRYSLGDFVRAGLPVALVFNAVALVAIPVFFPFR